MSFIPNLEILRKNRVDISTLTNDNIQQTLRNLKLINGEEPSDAYLASILNTIKQIVPNNVTVVPTEIGIHKNRTSKTISGEFVNSIRTMINYVMNNQIAEPYRRAMAAVLVVVSTNLSIGQIYRLTLDELKNLANNSANTTLQRDRLARAVELCDSNPTNSPSLAVKLGSKTYLTSRLVQFYVQIPGIENPPPPSFGLQAIRNLDPATL